MRQMGTWPFTTTLSEELSRYVLTVMSEIFIFLTLWGLFNQLLDYIDISLFAEGLCVFTTAFMSPIKSINALVKREKLREIFVLINDLYVNSPVQEPQKFKLSFEKTKKRTILISKFFFALSLSIILLYDILPLVKYLKTGEIVFQCPSKYPIDINNWMQYMVFYIAQMLCGYRVISMFAIDALFAAFITFTCTRIDVLLESVKQSIYETRKYKRKTKLFKQCILYQLKIMRLCHCLEEFYQVGLMTTLLYSTLNINFTCFLTTQINDFDKIIIFVLFFFCMMYLLFLFCYYGQMLENKLNWLTYELYFLPWYKTGTEFQKDYKFFIMRSSIKTEFRVYGVIPFNFQIFLKVLKTSLSYYTFLVNVQKEESN